MYGKRGFIGDVLIRNHIQNKALLIDLYNPGGDGSSSYAASVQKAGLVKTLIKIGNRWLGFWEREIFYPFIPRILLGFDSSPAFLVPHSFIEGSVCLFNWTDGDCRLIWVSNLGTIYGDGITCGTDLSACPPPKKDDGNFLSTGARDIFRKYNLHPILTAVPWINLDLKQALTASQGYPFLPLQREGVKSFDSGSHLTAGSRDFVTSQLALEFEAQKLWPLLENKDAK